MSDAGPRGAASRRTVLGVLAKGLVLAPFVAGTTACAGGDDDDDDQEQDVTSPWSVSPSYGSGWDPSVWTARVAELGVANVRGFRVDSHGYETIRAAGFTSTGILQWSATAEARLPADDLPGWKDYVSATVQAYPDVRQWEVWNEPPNFTTDSSPASYAKVVKAAYETAKDVDPGIQVGLATKSTNTAWLREAISAGAAGFYDYVTVHPYERAGAIVDGWEEPYLAILPQLQGMLAEVDPAKVDVPVEFTEVGAPAAQPPGKQDAISTPEGQARTLVKALTMGLAQGVRRVSWYDPFDGDYGGGEGAFGLIAQDGEPRASFGALGYLVAALGKVPQYVGVVRPADDSYLFVFSGPHDGAVLVGWTQGRERETSFDGPVAATNTTTGQVQTSATVTLGLDPVIVEVPSADGGPAWLSKARTAQGTRSGPRQSAGWDAGTGANGLYVRGLADAVVVDGRTVRQPGDSVVYLAVGPDFDWAASVVQVTAVVRGVRDGSGFNLKYDAVGPLASLDSAGQRTSDRGWQQPATGDWTTISWTLGDVHLAGMYGYNFRLDSDSQSYNGYQIASIGLEVVASRTVG